MKYTIKHLSSDAKPREKLLKNGASALSNEELLAIILGSGNKEMNVIELSRFILNEYNNHFSELARASVDDLTKIKGVGPVKAITLQSLFEIGRRKNQESLTSKQIVSSESAFDQVSFLSDLLVEEFWVLYLSRSNEIIRKSKISQGGVAGTIVDTKLIAKEAVSNLASSVILAHNHPSGNKNVSHQDKVITQKLKEGLGMLDVKVLDHIVVARNDYTSFADEGLL